MSKRKSHSLEATRSKYGYIFTSPFILGALIAVVYPVILSIIYAFCDVTADANGEVLTFVGFDNFLYIFNEDGEFKFSFFSTLGDTLINVPVVLIFSFFLASVLNTEFKGRGFARTILFLPMILNSGLVTLILGRDHLDEAIMDKSSAAEVGQFSGAFAEFLEELGIGSGITTLLSSSVDNIANILAMSVIPIVVMLAGFQSVPGSVYEASYVEGASKWEVFWKISLPIVSPMILVSAIYCIVDSFTALGNQVISRVEQECFNKLELGIGSSMAWAYLLVVILIVALVFLIANKFVSYSD